MPRHLQFLRKKKMHLALVTAQLFSMERIYSIFLRLLKSDKIKQDFYLNEDILFQI